MTQRLQVFKALRDGPGTSSEIAAELGIPPRQASAVLCTLRRQGRITRTERRVTNQLDPHKRTAYVYARQTQRSFG